jgi:ribosomal-protein-alanine N-acetyltransferase
MRRRVRIAPLDRADEHEFLAAVAASRKLHAPWVAPPATREAFRRMLERMRAPVNYAYVVRRRDSGALAGYVEITQVVRGPFRSAYLGYYVFAGHERQGLMAEALARVVRLAFTKLGLHRLEANMQPGNRASIALARACGFRKEGYSPRYLKIRGRWRDHERWGITREGDWQSR